MGKLCVSRFVCVKVENEITQQNNSSVIRMATFSRLPQKRRNFHFYNNCFDHDWNFKESSTQTSLRITVRKPKNVNRNQYKYIIRRSVFCLWQLGHEKCYFGFNR